VPREWRGAEPFIATVIIAFTTTPGAVKVYYHSHVWLAAIGPPPKQDDGPKGSSFSLGPWRAAHCLLILRWRSSVYS